MNNNEMHRLAGVLGSAISTNLASFIKIYAELAKRADIKNHSFTCSTDELAECLGYSRDDLDAILINFLAFGIIDVRMGYKDNTKRKITLNIY